MVDVVEWELAFDVELEEEGEDDSEGGIGGGFEDSPFPSFLPFIKISPKAGFFLSKKSSDNTLTISDMEKSASSSFLVRG